MRWINLLPFGLLVYSIVEIVVYYKTGCVKPPRVPRLCGENAEPYLYIFIGTSIVSVIMIFYLKRVKKL